MSSDTPEELYIDTEGMGRSVPFTEVCAGQLKTSEGLKHMRAMLKRWKRKGGEGGGPGNYDKLFEKLSSFFDDDEDVKDSIREMLEGTEEDGGEQFLVHFGAVEDDTKNDFMNTLNIIKWIDGPFMYK